MCVQYEISITKWRRYSRIYDNIVYKMSLKLKVTDVLGFFAFHQNAKTKLSVFRSIYLSTPPSIIDHYIALYRPYVPRLVQPRPVHRFSARASLEISHAKL